MTITVIVCAHNEERFIAACLHSVLAQTRTPDEVLVINNASTDGTGAVARATAGVRVIDELEKGLVKARERGRREAHGELLVFLDADCRAPILWLERCPSCRRRRQGTRCCRTGAVRVPATSWERGMPPRSAAPAIHQPFSGRWVEWPVPA